MLVEFLIIIASSRWKNPNKISLSFIFKYCFHDYISIFHLRKSTQGFFWFLSFSKFMNHLFKFFRRLVESFIISCFWSRVKLSRCFWIPKWLRRGHITCFCLVWTLHSVFKFVHGFFTAIKALNSNEVKCICNELCFDICIKRALTS